MASDVTHIICKILMSNLTEKPERKQQLYPKFPTQIWKYTPSCLKLCEILLEQWDFTTDLFAWGDILSTDDETEIKPLIQYYSSINIKVMRIKEMITREGTFWLANKFSLSAP